MENFDLQKHWHIVALIGGAILVFLLIGKRQASQDSSQPTIQQIGDNQLGLATLEARSQNDLASKAAQVQGFQGLLGYDVALQEQQNNLQITNATLTSNERIQNLTLATTAEIRGKELANDLAINTAQVGRDIKLGEIAASVQQSAIASQVSIAGIYAGVEGQRISADKDIAFRGFDSKDLETNANKSVALENTASNERLGLAGIDLQKYLGDLGFELGRITQKQETKRTRIGADRDVNIAQIAGTTQQKAYEYQYKAAHSKSIWDTILGLGEGLIGLL